MRAELQQKIETAIAQAERGDPAEPSPNEIAALFTTDEQQDIRADLVEEIEELIEEIRETG